MRIQIEPTEHILTVDDVEVRLWNGVSEDGTHCFVFVHRIVVREGEMDQARFERELLTMEPANVKERS